MEETDGNEGEEEVRATAHQCPAQRAVLSLSTAAQPSCVSVPPPPPQPRLLRRSLWQWEGVWHERVRHALRRGRERACVARRRRPCLARRASCAGTRAAQACPCQEARRALWQWEHHRLASRPNPARQHSAHARACAHATAAHATTAPALGGVEYMVCSLAGPPVHRVLIPAQRG